MRTPNVFSGHGSSPLASALVLLVVGHHFSRYLHGVRVHACRNKLVKAIDHAEKVSPLQVVGPWILVLTIGTKWADISRTLVDEPMPYHLVLTFEAFTSFTSWAICDRAEMGSRWIMYFEMGTRSNQSRESASFITTYLSRYCV